MGQETPLTKRQATILFVSVVSTAQLVLLIILENFIDLSNPENWKYILTGQSVTVASMSGYMFFSGKKKRFLHFMVVAVSGLATGTAVFSAMYFLNLL